MTRLDDAKLRNICRNNSCLYDGNLLFLNAKNINLLSYFRSCLTVYSGVRLHLPRLDHDVVHGVRLEARDVKMVV